MPRTPNDIFSLLISFFMEEFTWEQYYSCNFKFGDISLNLDRMKAYYWIDSENLDFLARMRLSADYDINFHLNLFNYFVDKIDENVYIKKIINKIVWVLICLVPYKEDIIPVVKNLGNKAVTHSWITDAVKERVEYLKTIFPDANDYTSNLDDFLHEFQKTLH
jgi:hypothetical protein